MGKLSPDILIHFTNSLDKLLSILKNNFYPRYCYEEFDYVSKSPTVEGAMPMVCFCDIPLSQVKNHIKTYGHYGLGLKKQWGIRKKLNPVIYFNKDSLLARQLERVFDVHMGFSEIRGNLQESELTHLENLGEICLEIPRYAKPYSGELFRDGRLFKRNVRFYDEREWRYVPPIALRGIECYLSKDDFLTPEVLERENRKLENKRSILTFNPRDIKFIIIDKESEIIPMLEALRKIKAKYPYEVVEILATRIVTTKQILNDF